MKKLEITLFLLLLTFGSHSFAKSSETENRNKGLNFSAYLAIEHIDKEGLSLKLNDGSKWEITYFGELWKLLGWGWTEQSNISHWAIEDTIEIQYPGSGNFTDFILVIYNTSKNEHALAYLKQAPSTDYSACLWVMDFDENTNQVTLSNGTIWFKTKTDMYGALFHQKSAPQCNWKVGDALTLLRAEGWLNSNKVFLWNHLTNEMPFVNKLE